MVTSEMIARQAGVGSILFNALDMAQYATVYAMIVIIGVLGFVARRAVRAACAPGLWLGPSPGTKSRWGRHEAPSAHGELLLGLLPIACLVALWHGIAASGMAPAALLPSPLAVFARLARAVAQSRVSGARRDHAVPPVCRLRHCRCRRRRVGRCRRRQPQARGAAQAAAARAGTGAENRALPRARPDPRLRTCLQDGPGRGRCRIPDPVGHLSGRRRRRTQAGVVGAGGGRVAREERC